MIKMTTSSGLNFNPLKILPDEINIVDIAHALSNICRYNGHCRFFYSVGQHSILLTQYILQSKLPNKLYLAKYALLHDASEAYLCDIPDPLKKLPQFEFYKVAEYNLQSSIYKKYGLEAQIPDDVKLLDIQIRNDEKNILFNNCKTNLLGININQMSNKDVKNNFLIYYNNLFE